MSSQKLFQIALVPLLFLSGSVARASTQTDGTPAVEPALVQSIAQTLLSCVEQPYGISARTGNKILGSLRSHCEGVTISQDRASLKVDGRSFTILVKDSAESDGGDLNDLFVQYDSREDQEIQLGQNLLSFGDPALSILLLSGHTADELPQVLDPSIK
jgi:hypothetical protein